MARCGADAVPCARNSLIFYDSDPFWGRIGQLWGDLRAIWPQTALNPAGEPARLNTGWAVLAFAISVSWIAPWWAEQDLNLRRRCRQIYSLLPLATRASTPI